MSEMDPSTTEPVQPAEQPFLAPPSPVSGPAEAPAVTPQPPSPGLGRRLAAAIVVAIIVATGGGIGIGWSMARLISSHQTAQAHLQTVPVTQGNGTANVQAITNKVDPAIVDINTIVQTDTSTSQAAGTGLIISSTGDVLTNNHVVNGSISIKVTIQNRPGTYTADVIGVDPTADIAVIHIENVSGLPTVTIADSSKLHVGDTVLAIGNALGLGGTPRATQGSISALDQTITASENGSNRETLTGMIQEDAEISPGDSGGALVNTAGQVIGIITAGEAQGFATQTSNVGYAIPSSTATQIANQILSGQAGNGVIIGAVGHLGVAVQTVTADLAAQDGLSVSSGALVTRVQPGSPAETAGMTAGSVITAINSTVIDSTDTLGTALHQFKPGDQVKVTWVDQRTTHSATVTLIAGPAV